MTTLPINWLDVIIMLALIAGMFVGFWQGIVRQAVTIVAFYVATVLSTRLYPAAAYMIIQMNHTMVTSVADVVSFFILMFVFGLVMVFLVMDFLRRFTDKPVSATSRVGGAVCAMVSTAVLITIVLVALAFMTQNVWPPSGEPYRKILVDARFSSNLVPVFHQLVPIVVQTISFWGGNMPPLFATEFGV